MCGSIRPLKINYILMKMKNPFVSFIRLLTIVSFALSLVSAVIASGIDKNELKLTSKEFPGGGNAISDLVNMFVFCKENCL